MFREKCLKVGIGQDSHRFLPKGSSKPCVIGGIVFDDMPGFSADSDGDVVFHAICNAISSITGVSILGEIAEELCKKDGISDSEVYVKRALSTMGGGEIVHVAITIEAKRPRLQGMIEGMKGSVASVLKIKPGQVGITVTSGDGLTDFGLGEGVHCIVIITARC